MQIKYNRTGADKSFSVSFFHYSTKPDSIIQRLYEDNIDGKISDERFSGMSATHAEERKQQPEKIPGTRTKKQTIAIIWNFIGAVCIPEEARKTA